MRRLVLLALLLGGCASPGSDAWKRAHFAIGPLVGVEPAVPLAITGKFPTAAEAALAVAPDAATLDAPPDPAVLGTVFGEQDGQPVPLADAILSTSDGRSARSAADGRFLLPGAPPADGAYVVAHDGYVAAGGDGLTAVSGLDWHLHPLQTQRSDGPTAALPLDVHGKLTDAAGAPVAGATVLLADPAGAFAAPAQSGSDGSYTLHVYAPARSVKGGSLLVVGSAAAPWLGLEPHDADEAAPDLGTLALQRPDKPLKLALDAGAIGGTATITPSLAGTSGPGLALPLDGDHVMVAALPDAVVRVYAEARNVERGLAGSVFAARVDPAAGSWAGTLLAVPDVPRPAAIALNADLPWQAVPGAARYEVTLADAGGNEVWTTTTTGTHAVISYQGALPAGRYHLAVAACTGAEVTAPTFAAGVTPADFQRSEKQVQIDQP